MSHLAVFLFGPPHLERDGESINVDTRKAIALLAYLAVTNQRHSRDALAALLWPDYDQPHARATLRRTLSALNKALAGNWLSIDRETVGLTPGTSFWLDVDEFNQQLANCHTHGHNSNEVCPDCLEPLTRAVKLYRDDFMAGFNLQDSSTFDDWQFFQSDGLRRELANVLERLVLCHSSKANFATAISYARRWLALDRLHEPAYRCLMQLYSWSGQRAAALQQYQECVHMLDQELGVAPLEATTQLYQAIKQNQGPPPPTPVQTLTATTKKEQRRTTTSLSHTSDSSSIQPSPTSYPLIGRREEWLAMQKAYASTFSSHGRVIVLEGEAGIGKTRLAQEFLSFSRDKDAALFITRCYEGETTLAYAPFVTGLRLRMAVVEKMGIHWQDQIATHWLSEAARLLPELHRLCPDLPPTPPLDSPGAQARFFEGLRQFLLALFHAEQKAPASILFIDDVQWADAASLDFLSYLVRRLHEHPLCLLLTWRTTQTAQSHRLHQLLATAHRAGQATQLQLARLNPATVQQLVQAAATPGLTATNGLAERLYQETEGLPLFLTEYLTAITHGMLETENDYWSLPGGVRDLLTSRLSAVGETSRQLLSTAAVIGRSFDFDTLREASGRSEEETVTALEELINHGLVAEIRGHQQASYAEADTQEDYTEQFTLFYDFSHEKLRTLVYEATSLARRRLLHRRIAEALVAHMRRYQRGETRAGKIAYHYQMAGNLPEAAHYYFRAGESALALYAYNEALAHFHAALASGHPEIARIHETIGDLHTLLGTYSAAITYYKTAATRCDGGAALAIIQHKLGIVHERRGEWEQAEHYYSSALETLGNGGSSDARARIYADWSLSAYHCHQNAKALDMAQQALHLAENAQDMRSLAQAHNMLGILASSNHNLTQATHHLEQSLALAENLQDTSIRAAALNNLAQVYKANGSLQQAINLTRSALTLSITYGDRHREAALHNNLADLLYAEGQLEDSMHHLKRAVSIYAEIGVEAGTVQPEIWKLAEW